MAGGVDHDHDDQAEDEPDPDRAERAVVDRVGDDRAAAGEDERERCEALGRGAPQQVRLGHRAQRRPVGAYSRLDLVANPTHCLDVLTGGILELPVLISLARVDRAGVAAAHRDHRVGGAHELVIERLRELLPEVDAYLRHRFDRGRVDLFGRIRAGGSDVHAAVGELVQQSRRHLAASRVVDAHEQDLGHVLGDLLVGLAKALNRSRAKR